MKLKLILFFICVLSLYAQDQDLNKVYNNTKVIADLSEPESCKNSKCSEYGSCFIFKTLNIFGKEIKIKLPLKGYGEIDNKCYVNLYHSINKVTRINNKTVIEFMNTSIGTFTEFVLTNYENDLKLIQIRQIGQSYNEDNALSLNIKNIKNFKIEKTLDFESLQNMLLPKNEFDCIYNEGLNSSTIMLINECIKEYEKAKKLLKNDKVEILEEKDDWLYILYKGKKDIKAWIPKSAIEETQIKEEIEPVSKLN